MILFRTFTFLWILFQQKLDFILFNIFMYIKIRIVLLHFLPGFKVDYDEYIKLSINVTL